MLHALCNVVYMYMYLGGVYVYIWLRMDRYINSVKSDVGVDWKTQIRPSSVHPQPMPTDFPGLIRLPVDLLFSVCEFLYADEHCTLAQCQTHLRTCLLDPRSWRVIVPYHSALYPTETELMNQLSRRRTPWTALRVLVIPHTMLRSVSMFPRLRRLECRSPVTLPGLDTLKDLQSLVLRNSSFHDLSGISNLTQLQKLHLRGADIDDIQPLASLINLRDLDLSHTLVEKVAPLSNLQRLQRLKLHNTMVQNIKDLSSIGTLQQLDISRTRVGRLPDLCNMSGLQDLNLSSTSIADIAELSVLTQLQTLQLHDTYVTHTAPLSALRNVCLLDLSYTHITRVSPLSSLHKLRLLFLTGNRIMDLSTLTTLHLHTLDIAYTQVQDVSSLTAVESLILSNTATLTQRPCTCGKDS
jgi:Leucine Rich repeats (2 copies)